MSSKADYDWTGALNLITHGEQIERYDELVAQYYRLNRELCTTIEMECMADYDYILEVYDRAIGCGLQVINTDFALATTNEEFVEMISKMEDCVRRLEAVKRVIEICFMNNFIRFPRDILRQL
ncbi:unnamed protein product [Caenorhabditis brenneri]